MDVGDHALRLLWALPLVLGLGVGLMFLLKRMASSASGPAAPGAVGAAVLSRTPISEHTDLVVLQVGAQQHVFLESQRHLQLISTRSSAMGMTRVLLGRHTA